MNAIRDYLNAISDALSYAPLVLTRDLNEMGLFIRDPFKRRTYIKFEVTTPRGTILMRAPLDSVTILPAPPRPTTPKSEETP